MSRRSSVPPVKGSRVTSGPEAPAQEEHVDALFAGKDAVVLTIYLRLLDRLAGFGPCHVEPTQTSIHLVRTASFAEVHPQKRALRLDLRTATPIDSPRIGRCEQVSTNRYHNEIRLTSPADVDAELTSWLRDAYRLD